MVLRWTASPDEPWNGQLKWSIDPVTKEPKHVVYVCGHCGSEIEEHHKTEMLKERDHGGQARWVPKFPGRATRGYQLSGLYAPIGLGYRWNELVREWLRAQGDRANLKRFVNTVLGEPWAARPHTISDRSLAERAEAYGLREIPPGCLLLTCGVDVQLDRLELQVLGHGRGKVTWTIDYLVIAGSPARDDVWDTLTDYLVKPFINRFGRELRIEATAVDTGGHNTDDVYNYVRRAKELPPARRPRRLTAIKGANMPSQPLLGSPKYQDVNWRGRTIKNGVLLWMVGTDTAKSHLFNRLKDDVDLDPAARLVRFSKDLPDDFYMQLTAERFDPEKNKWVKLRNRRNEALDCFDAETDVLTRAGWKRFKDLSAADELATVNLSTDEIEYQEPQALIQKPYCGEMVQLKGARIDILVTPNHRMVTLKKKMITPAPGKRRWTFDVKPEITLAKDLTVHHAIKLRATWRGVDRAKITVAPSISEQGKQIEPARELDSGDFAEMLGWWAAEGSVFEGRSKTQGNMRRRVQIAQIKTAPRAALMALLDRLPWRWRPTESGFVCASKQLHDYVKQFGRYQHERRVPRWIKDSNPETIGRFVTGAMAGDGWTQQRKPHHRVSRAYATTSRQLADDMQELFIKLGLAATMRVVQPKRWCIGGRSGDVVKTQYHVYDRKVSRAYLDGGGNGRRGFFGKRVPYDGMVYCATVQNGTLIVRRGGKTFIAGNCWVYGTAAAYHPEVRVYAKTARDWTHLEQLLEPPNVQPLDPAVPAPALPVPAVIPKSKPPTGGNDTGFGREDWVL